MQQYDSHFEDFKRKFGEQLGQLGLSLPQIELVGHDENLDKGGVVLARFNDNEGYPVTLILSRQYYTPSWFVHTRGPNLYWDMAIWGMIVKGSIPFTLVFAQVDKGFMKGQAKLFLPFSPPATSLPFKKEVLNSPLLQTKIVAALNSDKKTCNNVAKITLNCTVTLGSRTEIKEKWNYQIESATTYSQTINLGPPASDLAGRCVVIPVGDETAIFIRTYGSWGDPKTILESIGGIRKSILTNPNAEEVFGKIPNGAQWVNSAYSVFKTKNQ